MRVQHLGGYRQQTQAVGVFSDKWLTFSMRGGVLSHLRPAAACHCTATNGAFVTWGGGRDGERERGAEYSGKPASTQYIFTKQKQYPVLID